MNFSINLSILTIEFFKITTYYPKPFICSKLLSMFGMDMWVDWMGKVVVIRYAFCQLIFKNPNKIATL